MPWTCVRCVDVRGCTHTQATTLCSMHTPTSAHAQSPWKPALAALKGRLMRCALFISLDMLKHRGKGATRVEGRVGGARGRLPRAHCCKLHVQAHAAYSHKPHARTHATYTRTRTVALALKGRLLPCAHLHCTALPPHIFGQGSRLQLFRFHGG